jgi:3-phytase
MNKKTGGFMYLFKKQTGQASAIFYRNRRSPFLFRLWFILFIILLALPALAQTTVNPLLTLNDPGIGDQDDMGIWIHPDPSRSTIITSDKDVNKLFVYDLAGNTLQTVSVPGKPGNIDVRYNFLLSGQPVDIVGYNDRENEEIVFYKVDPSSRQLSPAGNFDAGNWPSELYGFCLYLSPNTGKYYAIGCGKSSQMRQWELLDNGDGTIGGIEKRTWTNGPGDKTEGMVADDETAKLYAANEGYGVYKYDADPDDPNPGGELIAPTGSNGLTADVEGVTIYYDANGEGYLVFSSQGSDNFKVYQRKPPHNFVKTFSVNGAGGSDGIDVANLNLGSGFPNGIFVLHNDSSSPKEVLVCDYAGLGLNINTGYWNPRNNSGTTPIFVAGEVPRQFELLQNYPNPFNPVTNIRFSIPRAANVELVIYDIIGRKVSTAVNDLYSAGTYVVKWQARDASGNSLPSGVYFARLQVAENVKMIKMIYNR